MSVAPAVVDNGGLFTGESFIYGSAVGLLSVRSFVVGDERTASSLPLAASTLPVACCPKTGRA